MKIHWTIEPNNILLCRWNTAVLYVIVTFNDNILTLFRNSIIWNKLNNLAIFCHEEMKNIIILILFSFISFLSSSFIYLSCSRHFFFSSMTNSNSVNYFKLIDQVFCFNIKMEITCVPSALFCIIFLLATFYLFSVFQFSYLQKKIKMH